MANGFGSLYVGAAGIRTAQTALDITANNLVNIDTKGYVREQVLFTDDTYSFFQGAAVSDQYKGSGVKIADVIHTRDMFLDKAFRSENSRYAFYAASYDAVTEVEDFLQEATGTAKRLMICMLHSRSILRIHQILLIRTWLFRRLPYS